jgi:dolichol-phosphate mannosyltransferase
MNSPPVSDLRSPLASPRHVTVVVPTFNEGGNIPELLRRLEDTFRHRAAEVLFVDDSTDDTPEIIRGEADQLRTLVVRLLHRETAEGGLSGAVTAGIRASGGDYVVVMDGDLQHPPEVAAVLLDTAVEQDADMVVASRYLQEGDAGGLSSELRRAISCSSTVLAQRMFPRRVGRVCTDPMTGFFCVRRPAVDLERLRPRGFKILLEILARHDLRVAEVPFVFGERHSGDSKASWRNGLHFAYQMLSLRMGRMARFAAVGALGTVVNLLVMALLLQLGLHYVVAAVVATEVAIAHNFLMQERFVFSDRREGAHSWRRRALTFAAFNNAETLIRLPLLVALVGPAGLQPVLAQGATLAFAFFVRFFFVDQVVYANAPSRYVTYVSHVVRRSPRPGTRSQALEEAA